MVQGSFELTNSNSIKIKGKSFDFNSFKGLNDILQKIINHKLLLRPELLGDSVAQKQVLLETKNLKDFYKKLHSILELEIVEDNNSKTIN